MSSESPLCAIMKIKQRTALAHLHASVQDADLRAKLTPDYTLGCKRILISNTYYPAMAQQNVEVIASGIREVTPQGVIGEDGRLREVDAIIFGTGFQTKDLPFSHLVFNAKGESLNQHWAGNPRAYMGTSLHGFPNLFLLHGPNIGLGHTSVVIMLEAQVEHILKVLGLMRDRAHGVIEPTAQAQMRFVDEMEQRIQGTVWTAGKCESWYLDATGKASSLWPTFTFSFMRRASRLRDQDYQSRRAPTRRPESRA
jgi:cation diffusion facilitator CzcD-associated flavoprotein CzcO